MDGLFVQRSTPKKKQIGAARLVVEGLAQEIVLDEAPDAKTLSPDERRFSGAGSNAERDVEATGDDLVARSPRSCMGGEADNGGMADLFTFAKDKALNGQATDAPTPGSLADSFFVVPKAPPAVSPLRGGPRPPPMNGVDVLFVNPRADHDGGLNATMATHDEENGSDARDAPADAELCGPAGGAETLGSVGGCCARHVSLRGLLMALLTFVALGISSASLATGCQDRAPLGRFCIARGWAQWAIASAPATVVLLCTACWAKRRVEVRRRLREDCWQHDGEAQRRAAEVLDALTAAPEAERVKYARQVVQILKDFPDKALIQQKGCTALEAICRAQRGNVERVCSAGAVPSVLAALEVHLRIREVQRAGLGALACLAKAAQRQIFSEGGIPIVLASMAKFKRDASVQRAGALVLGGICVSSKANRRSVGKYGGPALLLQMLERHVGAADAAIAVIEALLLLHRNEPSLRASALQFTDRLQAMIENQEAILADGRSGPKRARECEAVLSALRRFQVLLAEAPAERNGRDVEDDEVEREVASDTSTPRGDQIVSAEARQALELQERLQRWNEKKAAQR